MDLRHFISPKARSGTEFRVLLPGSIQTATGRWKEVSAHLVRVQVQGTVPAWVPWFGSETFDQHITMRLTDDNQATIELSGSVNDRGTGRIMVQSDELTFEGFHLAGALLNALSLKRWQAAETRFSIKAGFLPFWFESWLVHGDQQPTAVHPPFRSYVASTGWLDTSPLPRLPAQ